MYNHGIGFVPVPKEIALTNMEKDKRILKHALHLHDKHKLYRFLPRTNDSKNATTRKIDEKDQQIGYMVSMFMVTLSACPLTS